MASNNSSSSSTAISSILPTQLHFITIKLTQDNYLLWRAQLIPYLRGQNLFGYLDGSVPCPAITIPNSSTHIPNPEYIHWSQQDQIILSALLSSLTESLLTQVVGLTSSRAVWLALEKTFSSTSSARILSMRFQLSTLKKASLTITDYFTKVKQLSDTLSAISHPLDSSEITSYLLAGLPPSYDSLSLLLPLGLNLSRLMNYMVASSLMKIVSTNKTPPLTSVCPQLTLSPPIPLGVTIICLHIEVDLTMEISLEAGGVDFTIPSHRTNHNPPALNVKSAPK
jgi:hypothetical protein